MRTTSNVTTLATRTEGSRRVWRRTRRVRTAAVATTSTVHPEAPIQRAALLGGAHSLRAYPDIPHSNPPRGHRTLAHSMSAHPPTARTNQREGGNETLRPIRTP